VATEQELGVFILLQAVAAAQVPLEQWDLIQAVALRVVLA
jgi:hypothetical protein